MTDSDASLSVPAPVLLIQGRRHFDAVCWEDIELERVPTAEGERSITHVRKRPRRAHVR